MKKLLAITLFGSAMAVSAGSYALEPPTDKKYTLDVTDVDGSRWVGGRMFIDEDTAVEARGALLLAGKDTDNNLKGGTLIAASGGIMKYISKGRVSPFMRAGGSVSLYFGDRYDNVDNNLTGYAGVGAEFMVTEELSIRASANAMLEISPFVIGTATSEVSLSFFF